VLTAARITRATISNASVSVYINNFGEYHHPYEKLRNNPRRFFCYLRGKINPLAYFFFITHGAPINTNFRQKWQFCTFIFYSCKIKFY
jgi:hypothetical protein